MIFLFVLVVYDAPVKKKPTKITPNIGHLFKLLDFCRSEQTKSAEKASITVFCDNLHRLLLTPPVKGKTVLGIDPGFKNGCKAAVVSATGKFVRACVCVCVCVCV